MHNNNNTTHQCVDPAVSGSGGPYTSLELRDGQQTDKDTLSALFWVWQKGCPGNQLELCATHWAPTNSMARMPRSSQIWRPSLVCTSQPHSARNDDLLLLLGSTVQSSIIHSATGGSTLPFLSSGIEWIRYIHPRFQSL